MKRYIVEASPSGVEVLVSHSDHPDDTTVLENMPGGFEWGYEGSGPARLAFAILKDLVPNRFASKLMRDVISKASPIERHERVVVFHEDELLRWLRDTLNEME